MTKLDFAKLHHNAAQHNDEPGTHCYHCNCTRSCAWHYDSAGDALCDWCFEVYAQHEQDKAVEPNEAKHG